MERLKKLINNQRVSGYIIPKNDEYFNEYIHESKDRLKFISNFSGSAGFAVILKNFDFKPSIHVHYNSRTVSVVDGLPKFKDLPKEFNGTGEITSE